MKASATPSTVLRDPSHSREAFHQDVLRGLRRADKELPCKYFYDDKGSQLFDSICDLDEYYPTRVELAIMREHGREMGSLLGPRCMLIEYGSGSSTKTRILLDCLKAPSAYVPVEICREHLARSASQLAADYPHVDVLPLCADFTGRFALPACPQAVSRQAVYFPGSTIGNFGPPAAEQLLRRIAALVGPGGALLVGVDLKKDRRILELAYNDDSGVTAAFNLNLLARINRELDADFCLDKFRHHAFYNARDGRIEMHLVSIEAQTVGLDGAEISFQAGESVRTECSYKYSLEEFAALADAADFELVKVWTDSRQMFSVQFLVQAGHPRDAGIET